jgi:tetratricopeptide (TPR) repeat protein
MNVKPGRNEPCPCGSGKKYKKCCSEKVDARLASVSALAKGSAPKPVEISQLLALLNAGCFAELESRAFPYIKQYPDNGFLWKLLGTAFHQMGRDADALAAFQKAAILSPGDGEAHSNFGCALNSNGRLNEAEASHRRALQIKPDHAVAHNNLGLTLNDLGRLDEAETSYRRALELKPDFAEAHLNLGNALQNLGRLDDALASYRRALELKPNYAEAYSNLGSALQNLGRLDDALASYRRALEIKPDYAEAYSNLGSALQDLGRLDDAMASYYRALEIKPHHAETHYNLGDALLLSGRLSEGWHKYEYRWKVGSPRQPRPATSLPQWTGQTTLPDDRLLIFTEQGMGDRLQFSRYLPLAGNRFRNGVSVVVDRPLQALFRRSFPDVEILDAVPVDQSAWQWQCPLLSLPLAFGTTLETIPRDIPYLVPEPARASYWHSRIAALGLPDSARKIGVVWKPGKLMKNANLRSLSLQQLAPLLNQPGCSWFSLQKEPDPDRMPWVSSGKLIDWSEEFSDFGETAGLLTNLDLVVSVDTSVAHLAGALGKPVWLLNRHASEWRWMRNREDSPWYPTMRIFTQKRAGDWDETIGDMAAALTALSASGM